jgi:hypothetical protein
MTEQEVADALRAAGIPFNLIGGAPRLVIDGVSVAAAAAATQAAAAAKVAKKVKATQTSYASPDDKEILAILRDKKLGHIHHPDGSITVKDSLSYKGKKIKSLGSIKEITGSLELDKDTGITSLGALTRVGSYCGLSGLPLTSLDNLEEVGGKLDIGYCAQLEDLGMLTKVGGSLVLLGCDKLTHLGANLLEIGGDLHAYNSSTLRSLGSLTKIGKNINCDGLVDLGDLEYVGGQVSLSRCSGLTTLGKLKECQSLYISCTAISTLGPLTYCHHVDARSHGDDDVTTPLWSLGNWKGRSPVVPTPGEDDDDDDDGDGGSQGNVFLRLKGFDFDGPVEDLRLIFDAVVASITVEDASVNSLRKPHQLIASISRAILEGRTKKGDTK